eukprot:Pgem_evm1s12337
MLRISKLNQSLGVCNKFNESGNKIKTDSVDLLSLTSVSEALAFFKNSNHKPVSLDFLCDIILILLGLGLGFGVGITSIKPQSQSQYNSQFPTQKPIPIP